ncbi:MAG: zinc-dependent metalloprotease, partial [Pedobacter sp.]
EKAKLDVWTKEKAGNPLYFYGRQGNAYDPRDQSEDLGDNAMKASTYGIANLKRILPNAEKWTYEAGKDYSNLSEIYSEIIGQFSRYMGHVTFNIGGLSENYKTYDQAGAVYKYVSKATQKEAVDFLNKQLFTSPLWLINSDLLNKFDNGSMLTRIKSAQTSTVNSILTSSRLLRLIDNEAKNGATAYTVPELFTDLRSSIFAAGRPDGFKRNLQRGYVDRLGSLMVDAPMPTGLPPGFSFTPVNVGVTDIRPLVRVELKTLYAASKARAAAGDAITKAHYDDLAIRINDILNPKK